MRQRPFVLVRSTRREAARALRSSVLLASLALFATGCAHPSLMPDAQATAIKRRDQALAPHAEAIQAAIRQSGEAGALVFLDDRDGRLVVLPGETPVSAWARHAASPASEPGRPSVPPVVTFVHRADVPRAPEPVSVSVLQQHETLRTSLGALETDVRDAQRRTDERLGVLQLELAESVAAAKQEVERSLAARAELQRALGSLADELAAARKVIQQTDQLGRLTHELVQENASGLRKMVTTSAALTATSTRLVGTMQQLSERLASQLKELMGRLDQIETKMGEIK
jgi:chemotaxis protein histidine kinase CheA